MQAPRDQITAKKNYRFGDFLLDVELRVLFRNGEEIELRPQSFDVLWLLVENAGQLLSKDKVYHEIWGNIAVTDDSLTQCVVDIRKALNDTDKTMLRTVPRRGYLFSQPVLKVAATTGKTAAPLRTKQTSLLALIIVLSLIIGFWLLDFDSKQAAPAESPSPNSLAVMPFVNSDESGGANNSTYLGTAFSDELRDNLSRIQGLRLSARSSSVVIFDQGLDAVTMAKKLAVAHIVEGSFLQSGDKLLVTVQLIEGRSGLTLWSQTYHRRKAEMIAVHQSMVNNIGAHILPGADISAATVATHIPSANELMLLARHYERQVRDKPEVDVPVLLEAIRLYREATEIDPESALAFSRLAGALLYFGDLSGAEAPIFRALTLNSNMSEIQDTLGKYYWARRLDGAGSAWEKAFELNPNNSDALASYAFWLWMQGNSTGPDKYYSRALDLDPLSLSRYGDLGNFLGTQGKTSQVRELIEKIKSIFNDAAAYALIARLHEFLGELDHAIAWTIRARNLEPDNPVHLWKLTELYAMIGLDETARSIDSDPGMGPLFFMQNYQDLVDSGEMLMIDEPGDVMVRYLLAFAYNATGEYASAAHLMRMSGIAETKTKWPSIIEFEALVTYFNSLYALGETAELYTLADTWINRNHVKNTDWWIHTYRSCVQALLGHDEVAITELELISNSTRLPWYPVVMDSQCFARFSDDPRYHKLLEVIETRRADLRARLSATLESYAVTL